MKAFKIVYCFTDKNGIIETNENGEVIHADTIEAESRCGALAKLFEKEKFITIPDILDIVEVQIWFLSCVK